MGGYWAEGARHGRGRYKLRGHLKVAAYKCDWSVEEDGYAEAGEPPASRWHRKRRRGGMILAVRSLWSIIFGQRCSRLEVSYRRTAKGSGLPSRDPSAGLAGIQGRVDDAHAARGKLRIDPGFLLLDAELGHADGKILARQRAGCRFAPRRFRWSSARVQKIRAVRREFIH